MSGDSLTTALEMLDKPQETNPMGKQFRHSVTMYLHQVISPQVQGLQDWTPQHPGPRGCSRDSTCCKGRAKPQHMERWAREPVGNISLGYWPGRSLASSANIDCKQMLQGMGCSSCSSSTLPGSGASLQQEGTRHVLEVMPWVGFFGWQGFG